MWLKKDYHIGRIGKIEKVGFIKLSLKPNLPILPMW
jgi:hypothetical protein